MLTGTFPAAGNICEYLQMCVCGLCSALPVLGLASPGGVGVRGRAGHKSWSQKPWAAASECGVGTFCAATWPPRPTGGETQPQVCCAPQGSPRLNWSPITAWQRPPALAGARAILFLLVTSVFCIGASRANPRQHDARVAVPIAGIRMLSVAGINNSSANALP